jgi:phosphoserine phosphatase
MESTMKQRIEGLWERFSSAVSTVAFDNHGTLSARDVPDNLALVRQFRALVSAVVKAAGIRIVVVSAMPSREGEALARLLALQGQIFIYELGHLYTPAVLEVPPQVGPAVTPEVHEALFELKRWLEFEPLPPSMYIEPKRLLLSVHVGHATAMEKQCWLAKLHEQIATRGMPLQLHASDATMDIGACGLDKATAYAMVRESLHLPAGRLAAFGDSVNDVELLRIAGWRRCGCPRNAAEPVKVLVRHQQGFVSPYPYLRGTLDTLEALLQAHAGIAHPDGRAG